MADGWKIVLTAGLTLLGGIVLLLLGKAIEVLILTPLQKYRENSSTVLERMDFYSNRLTNFFSDDPGDKERDEMRKISHELRSVAMALKASYLNISFRRVLVKIKWIASRADLNEAVGKLTLLSNNLPQPEKDRRRPPELSPIAVNHEAMDRVTAILEAQSINSD
jgi:hypothetical protein